MKQLFRLFFFSCVAMLTCAGSCEHDIDDEVPQDLIGEWSGTFVQGNQKEQTLTVTFNNDWTGTLTYDAPTGFSAAAFKFSVSGSTITCDGVKAISGGDIDIYTIRFRKEGNRLIPLNNYTKFILTKDGSVTTDYDGEIKDNSEYLTQVWVESSRSVVVEFRWNGQYEEYVLSSPGSKYYTEINEGTFTYKPLTKRLKVDLNYFDVEELTASRLVIKSESGRQLVYSAGSKSDIPTMVDYSAVIIIKGRASSWVDDVNKNYWLILDGDSMKATLFDGPWPDYNRASIKAEGSFTLSGNILTCRFTEVNWYNRTGKISSFPGWAIGQSRTITYTINDCDGKTITLTDSDGKKHYLKNQRYL